MTSRLPATFRPPPRKRGQTLLVMVIMMVALVVFLLIVFDVFLGARGKRHVINAGDAAALAGAAAQGRALNRIGELNLEHLAVMCEYAEDGLSAVDREMRDRRIEEIVREQERVALLLPLDGFRKAQQVAKRNLAAGGDEAKILSDAGAEKLLREELDMWSGGTELEEAYHAGLQSAISGGIVAMDQNAKLRCDSITGHHWYYEQSFYSCLRTYVGNRSDGGVLRWFCRCFGGSASAHDRAIAICSSWSPPNPDDITTRSRSGGLFDVNAMPVSVCFTNDISENAAEMLLAAWNAYRGGGEVTKEKIEASGVLGDTTHPWYFYGSDWVGRWNAMKDDDSGAGPLIGKLKAAYDVPGAMSAVRVVAKIKLPSRPEVETSFPWTASARPFGALWDSRRVTELFGDWEGGYSDQSNAPLVLPSFTTARLFKYNASRQPQSGGTARPNVPVSPWVYHKKHVADGKREAGCKYCEVLKDWEGGLASEVAAWLRAHPHDEECDPPCCNCKQPVHDHDDGNN